MPKATIRLHIFRSPGLHAGHEKSKQPWYWHATLGNNEIVATGEQYENREDIVTMLTHLFGLADVGAEMLREDGTVSIVRAADE